MKTKEVLLGAVGSRFYQRWKLSLLGRSKEISWAQVVLLIVSCLLLKAGYLHGSKDAYSSRNGRTPECLRGQHDDDNSNAVGFPGRNKEDEEDLTAGTDSPSGVSTTGQRVAGHLLAVLLLASVAAAIVEAVRARMAQCKSGPKTSDAGSAASESHHSSNASSGHGSTGRVSRRTALQEKSLSQDSHLPRARSCSAGGTSHQVGNAAAAAAIVLAAARTQKAVRARLIGGRPLAVGGRVGGTPPLLRRSSFPVMTRTSSTCGRESNSGSPGMGTRKPSVSDLADDDMGERRRIRIIRRF